MAIKIEVSLADDVHGWAILQAERLEMPLEKFVEQAVRTAFALDQDKPWMKFAGMIDTGDPHSSSKIDEIYDDL